MSHWPQLLTLFFMAGVFAMNCDKAGQPRPPYSPHMAVIGITLELLLLWCGGYFAPLGWGAP